MPTYAFFNHDRFRHALAILAPLGVGQCRLYGHIAHLERWMSDFRILGDLSGIEDDRLEAAAGWTFPEVPEEWAGKLIAALRRSGLIHEEEGRVQFRGWPKYAPEYVKLRIKRMGSAAGGQRPTLSDNDGQCRSASDDVGQRRTTCDSGLPEKERRGEGEEECARTQRVSERVRETAHVSERVTGAGVPPADDAEDHDDMAAAEAIYAAYPRKAARGAALQAACAAIATIRARGVPDAGSWLLGRVRAFARSPAGNAGRFTPHPATWLRGQRYDDDDAEWETRDDHAPANGTARPGRVEAPPGKYDFIDRAGQ